MNRLLLLCLLPVPIALSSGCQAPAPTPRAFSHVRLPGVSRATAFDAMQAAMRERYQLATVDADAGVIRSTPTETRESNDQGRVGDFLGAKRRMRRVATSQVTGTDTSAEVWCKIVIQQQDTQAARLFDSDMRLNDAPTATAADRDAATTREQNEIWRTTSRDRRGERELLRAVEEIVAPQGGTSAKPGS